MELTTPYNPQQNGVVERKTRKIMEDAREMLHDQDIPMHVGTPNFTKNLKFLIYIIITLNAIN